MTEVGIVLAIALSAMAVAFVYRSRERRRRDEAAARRLTPEQRERVAAVFPIFARLPVDLRDRLESLMHVFMDEKAFEACGGLEAVTEEMRLSISAQACLLLVNRDHDHYSRLRSVLIYPNAYRARDEWGDEDVRLGESWDSGSVVLAWDSVRAGSLDPEDGLNVTLHEFAHQLDQAHGTADGLPELNEWQESDRWAGVFGEAYDAFCEDVNDGRRTVLDSYGATNPAEFFAVATETFFEKPVELERDYPALFGELREFYNLDPREWAEAGHVIR